ncbi:MAG: hypothetical protein WC752_03280 [Patescibacteria group bacterium]
MLKKICLLLACAILFSGCLNQPQANTNSQQIFNANRVLLYIQDGQIYAAEEDGQDPVNVSNNNKENFSPVWITKGAEALFIAKQNEYYEVWQTNLESEDTQLLWGSKKEPNLIALSPDNLWLTYAEEGGCFLFNKEEKNATRISEECNFLSWAHKKKRFVYISEDKLFVRDFNIKQDLSEPKEIYSGELQYPLFLDDNTIIFEAPDENSDPATHDIYKLSLEDSVKTAITDLNWPGHENVRLAISPDKEKIAYSFDEETWLIPIASPELAKQVLTKASDLIWDMESSGYYYTAEEVDENNELRHNIYRATKDGLNKQLIINNAEKPVL